MNSIRIIGGGPAGASAAIAALHMGAAVEVLEKSRFPRHKVCGEFLSPEIAAPLEHLGILSAFLDAKPARISRFLLHFGRKEKRAILHEQAFGLSRARFDDLLLRHAGSLGAVIAGQDSRLSESNGEPSALILASGRYSQSQKDSRGRRIFGFKAHFRGPASDAVELFFFQGCYVGLNTVEDGITNVCGLGPESILQENHFDIDRLVARSEPLRDRLRPLERLMDWMNVGPLFFRNSLNSAWDAKVYPAGDRLSFVDPFTGSGLLSALFTGTLAGESAAGCLDPEAYRKQCRTALRRPFQVSSLFRLATSTGWAEHLVGLAPASLLFRLTRPTANVLSGM